MKLNSTTGIVTVTSVALFIALIICVRWTLRRQRRMVRDDLEQRGLVPNRHHHRHHHHHSEESQHRHHREEKRNPTLAERGGLPPVRTGAPRQQNAK